MQTPLDELSETTLALLGRVGMAEQAWRDGVNNLQAANWLVVTALVRERVPEATGIRTVGHFNEDGLLRLNLTEVLGDSQPLILDDRLFSRLEDDLAEPLMTIAELESNPELWLPETDHDLPEVPTKPGLPTELLVTLASGPNGATAFGVRPSEVADGVHILRVLEQDFGTSAAELLEPYQVAVVPVFQSRLEGLHARLGEYLAGQRQANPNKEA